MSEFDVPEVARVQSPCKVRQPLESVDDVFIGWPLLGRLRRLGGPRMGRSDLEQVVSVRHQPAAEEALDVADVAHTALEARIGAIR
jgi:hypothetical protein